MKIIQEILEKMTKISKPQKKFVNILMNTILSMAGRVNFSNMARYANIHERTFSRNFSKWFDYLEFNLIAVKRVITQKKRLILAFDPFFIEKSGKKTYGRESFWNGSQSKSEKGLEASGLALIDVDANIGYPLAVQQTPPKDEIIQIIGKSDATRINFYIHSLQGQLPKIRAKFDINLLVCDAYFAKEQFISAMRSDDYHVISRLRSDANLRYLVFEQNKGRGRPRKYGKKVDVKDLSNFNFSDKIDEHISLYLADYYSISLKRTVRVVCVKNKESSCLLFSTDLTLNARDIYDFYKARFQIEFIFRDAKQFTGLTESQARSKEKLNHHFNASFSALTIAKIQEVETRKNLPEKVPFSMASHKRKNYNEMLTKQIISKLGLDPSSIKLNSTLKSAIEFGMIRC